MSMSKKTVAMIGYDISHLSQYIGELESEEWVDGIPEYSLNFGDNKIGYDVYTRSVFGLEIFNTDDYGATEASTIEIFPLADLEKYRAEIWQRYKLFLFDHTKLNNKTEPPFVIKLISVFI